MPSDQTKTQILDAAERLFADRGYAATSVRDLTAEADVSLAAMNYHFGSKDGLFRAVLQRSFAPLDRDRLRRLDELEAEANLRPVAIEDLLGALIEPALTRAADSEHGEAWLRLIGRIRAEPSAPWRQAIELIESHMHMLRRYVDAFAKALPDLTPQEVRLRFFFMMGVIMMSMTDVQSLPLLGSSIRSIHDEPDEVSRQLIHFVAAGFRAPSNTEFSRPPRSARRGAGKR